MTLAQYADPPEPTSAPSTRRIAKPSPGAESAFVAALAIIVLFFGVFGVWSATAPLQSATLAPGVVAVESNRKTVAHLEGGIVQAVRVREGDLVAAGQTLIVLTDAGVRAARNQLQQSIAEQMLIRERLIAEFEDQRFRPGDAGPVEPAVWQRLAADQQRILTGRRALAASQLAVIDQRAAQAEQEIVGHEAQIRAERRQVELVLSELEDMRKLLRSGLVPRSRVLSLERRQAELDGSIQVAQSAIARAKEAILEARLKREEVLGANRGDVLEQLRAAEARLAELNEKLGVADDALARLEVRAPMGGRVVGLQMHTPGGVVTPGKPLLDIVPANEPLIVEAQVEPKDIDQVREGQAAQLRILAFNQRLVAPIPGRVLSVGADRQTDARTGQAFYLVRVAPERTAATAASVDKLQPGMPADAVILAEQRTLLDYLVAPLSRSVSRALREP